MRTMFYTIYALSSRVAINHDLSFALSLPPVSSSRRRARARFRVPRERKRERESRGRERERGVEAPAPAIDSLGYIRSFKSYYHQRTRGCHQWRTAPRPRTKSSRVSPFGPRQVGKDSASSAFPPVAERASGRGRCHGCSLPRDGANRAASILTRGKESGFSVSIVNTYGEVEDSCEECSYVYTKLHACVHV